MAKTREYIEKEAEEFLENTAIPTEYVAGTKELLVRMMSHEAYNNPK